MDENISLVCSTDVNIAWYESTSYQFCTKVKASAKTGTEEVYLDVNIILFNLKEANNIIMETGEQK